MKLITALAAVTLAQAATLDNTYLPPNAQGSAGSSGFLQTPQNSYGGNQNGFSGYADARPERPQAAFERNAAILRQDYSNDGQRYAYSFETENGISADENGVATNGVQAQGGFSYTGDDGKIYSIRYTADVNGYRPQGDHLPTPPPIPAEILKALEQNARDEAAGIRDDGSYSEVKYGGGEQLYNTNAQPIIVNSNSAVNNEYLPPSGQSNNQNNGY